MANNVNDISLDDGQDDFLLNSTEDLERSVVQASKSVQRPVVRSLDEMKADGQDDSLLNSTEDLERSVVQASKSVQRPVVRSLDEMKAVHQELVQRHTNCLGFLSRKYNDVIEAQDFQALAGTLNAAENDMVLLLSENRRLKATVASLDAKLAVHQRRIKE